MGTSYFETRLTEKNPLPKDARPMRVKARATSSNTRQGIAETSAKR